MSNKAIGYLLLTIGIAVIVYSAINIYQTFKGQITPYTLFAFNGISVDLSKFVEGAPKNASLTQELIAPDLLNKPMNLVFHIILMGFIASTGAKLANIGTLLVRTINVNLKEERETHTISQPPNKPSWK